jgi:hypothetical protein
MEFLVALVKFVVTFFMNDLTGLVIDWVLGFF